MLTGTLLATVWKCLPVDPWRSWLLGQCHWICKLWPVCIATILSWSSAGVSEWVYKWSDILPYFLQVSVDKLVNMFFFSDASERDYTKGCKKSIGQSKDHIGRFFNWVSRHLVINSQACVYFFCFDVNLSHCQKIILNNNL